MLHLWDKKLLYNLLIEMFEVIYMSSNPEINEALGNKLRIIRKDQKITREALAEKLNVSPRFLADVESGKVGISLTTLKNICVVTGTSADSLLGLDSEGQVDSDEIVNRLNMLDPYSLEQLKNIVRSYCDAIQNKSK